MRGKMLGSTDDQPPTASTDDQPPSPYEKHLITEEQHLQSPLLYKEKHVGENNRNDAQQQPGKNNAFCSDEKEKSRSSIIINENYYSGGNNLLLGAAPRKKSTRRLSWADRKSEEQTQGESFLTDELESKGVRTRRRSNVSLISSNSSAQSNDGMPMRRILKVTKRGSGSSSGMGSSLKSNPHGSSSNSTTIPRLSTSTPLGCMKDDDIDQVVIEQKKSRAIWCLRTLTITTLTTAAVIVAFLTYTTSRNSELQVFNTQYEDSVVKVAEAISSDIDNKLNSAMSFSAMYTSRYGSKNNWPNVTMPYFEEQAKGLLDTSGGIALSFNPIITNVTRTEWEAHAVESAYIFGAEQLVSRSCDTCRIVADGIFRRTNGKIVDDPGYSPESRNPYVMVPVWQIYPTKVNWRAVMFNLHSEKYRQDALDDMLQHKVPTLTGLLHLVQHDEMDPSSILFYPVMDRFNSSRFFKNVVGSISIVFTWGDILKSVLPGYIKGLIVVLEKRAPNEEDPQVFTYSISGDVVTLLGDGDLHDPRYDQYEHIVNTNVAQGAENLANIDVLVRYRLLIYPSKELQYSYLTFKPIAMTFIVLALFVFTSAVFLFYDYLVYNRQNAIMKFAQRSGHIVNSLFPSGVRERLFSSTDQQLGNHSILDKKYTEDETEKEESGELLAHPQQKRNPAHHIKQFLKSSFNRSDTVVNHNNDGRSYIQNTPPIADLFPNSSILFADIVSFTSWSSEHAPEDVFYLLETLFLEFDKTAERMGVFKLGTIGDCYIAVTGVPDPREDHAVVLAKFADQCRTKTNLVLSELVNEFGSSVNRLSMRFGIHSGPVTAGVLRGLKSRFELFGDTINTASRMESTGLPNMIQISSQTAKLLEKEGHKDWFTPREDLVHAKGKGELQTYWLDVNGDGQYFRPGYTQTQDTNGKSLKGPASSQSSFVHEVYSNSQSLEDKTFVPIAVQDNIDDDSNLSVGSSHSSVFKDS